MTIDVNDLIDDLIEERELNCSPEHFRAKTAIKKLAPMYEDTEYGDLWLAVLGLAVVDIAYYEEGTRNEFFAVDAHRYLSQSEIPACSVAGICSDYAKRIISSTLKVKLG